MKIKQKFAMGLATLTLLTSMGSIMSSAGYETANLYADQFYAYTPTVYGTFKYIWGDNTSKNVSVYFRGQYSNGSGFNTKRERLVDPGSSLGETATPTLAAGLWRLELNTFGLLLGGTAKGYIRNY